MMQSDVEEEEDREIKLTDSEEYSDQADYDRDSDENDVFMLTDNHLSKPLPHPALEGKKVQAQRKFAQGAYVPPNANVTNTVVNRRVDPTNGKPKSYFFRHNTSARKLLDSISFESIHKHNPIVLLERLQEQPIVQMDDEPNSSNELPTPAVCNVTTKAQVHPVPKKVTKLTNITQNIASCICTKPKAENKIRKVITKRRQSKNYLLKALELQKVRSQKCNMKLRSAIPTSAVDEDFSIDDDKPLMFYTKKTLKPKRMTKKQDNPQYILKTKKDVLTSPQPAETDLSHNNEKSHNIAMASHSEISFANEPEQKSRRNEISKRNETVNSKDKKTRKHTLNHDEEPSPKKANRNISSTRNEVLNNKEVLNCNESPSRKKIPNGNAKEATICVEDTNLKEAPYYVKLPVKIQLALAAHICNESNGDDSQLTTFARSCPVAKGVAKNGFEVNGAENDTVSKERPERPMEATHIFKTCKFCKSLKKTVETYQKTVRHERSITLNSGITISQVSRSITALLTALETGKLASHILPLQFNLPIQNTSAEKEEERRNTVACKEKPLKKRRQSVACQRKPVKERRQSVASQEKPVNESRQSGTCLEKPLKERRQSVACLEKPLKERRQSVACQEKQVRERRKSVACQEKPVNERRQSVACLEKPLKEQRQSVACLEKPLKERRQSVACQENQVRERRKSVASQEKPVKERRQSVACQEKPIKERRQSITYQEKPSKERRQSVACQEKQVRERRKSVGCQEKPVKERRQSVACQEKPIKERRQSVAYQEKPSKERRQSVTWQEKPVNERRYSIASMSSDECVSPTESTETEAVESQTESKETKQMGKTSHQEKINKTCNTGKGKIVEAPSFRPTEAEFRDPVAYFQKITPEAAKYGLCKVIAPPGFKPTCILTDSIRFVVTNQYLSRFYSRWGPVTRELCALRSFLASQNITFSHSPLLEGLEVNLPKMLHFVQRQGGLKANVKSRTYVDTRKWNKLAEELNYTKLNNPAKKLDQIYVKYLLPYDALTQRERQELTEKMDRKWSKRNDKLILRAQNPLHRQKRLLGESDSSDDDDFEDNQHMTAALNEAEECVVRGRVMNLANFKKIATTARKIFFPSTPTTSEIESQYWKLVLLGNEHVCVNTASIDTGAEGYGFSKNKNEQYGKHPWNLKMLSQNSGNVLRSLGPVLGVTVPTLHVGMIYSTSCWHRDPHGLPWIEYMHTGPEKIWYGIPDSESNKFRRAVESLCPTACQNKSIWLPSDIAMIPPTLLLERNVSMSRVVQKPGEYIIVFPKAYSCSICTGYTVSESVYFATNSWVKSVNYVFQELRQSCEPTMFSLEQLLISVARDPNASLTMLQLVHESFSAILSEELENRRQLEGHGLKPHIIQSEKRSAAGAWNVHENECEVCRSTLYLSRVKGVFRKKYSVCLRHALQVLETKNKKIERCETETFELEYFFSNTELEEVISSVIERLTKTT